MKKITRGFGLLLILVLFFSGCDKIKAMREAHATIQKGSKVSVDYTLKVEGQVVDSSEGKAPMNYVQGEDKIIPGFQKRLEGLKAGDSKNFSVPPEEAYGPVNPQATKVVEKKLIQGSDDLKPGDMISGTADGHPVEAKVVSINNDKVTLDLNHPLAGKTLDFEVKVVKVEPGQ